MTCAMLAASYSSLLATSSSLVLLYIGCAACGALQPAGRLDGGYEENIDGPDEKGKRKNGVRDQIYNGRHRNMKQPIMEV